MEGGRCIEHFLHSTVKTSDLVTIANLERIVSCKSVRMLSQIYIATYKCVCVLYFRTLLWWTDK